MGDHTTSSNGGLDKSVQFFVTTNGKLQMTRSDTLHFQILAGVTSKFEYLSREVFEDGGCVNSCGSSNTVTLVNRFFEETVNTTNWELKTSFAGTRLRRLLGSGCLASFTALSTEFSSFARLWKSERLREKMGFSSQEQRSNQQAPCEIQTVTLS